MTGRVTPAGRSTVAGRLRQPHLMLSKHMQRRKRVILHGESPPDTVRLESASPGPKNTKNKASRSI